MSKWIIYLVLELLGIVMYLGLDFALSKFVRKAFSYKTALCGAAFLALLFAITDFVIFYFF